MFPLLVGINLDDLPIGDANDTKSAPIVNKNIRFVREGWKKETLASSHFSPRYVRGLRRGEQRRHPPKNRKPRPDVHTQCLDSSSRSTAYTRCMCTRARAQRLAVSMRGSNLIPGKRPLPLPLPLYHPVPFFHLSVCPWSNFLLLHWFLPLCSPFCVCLYAYGWDV